MKRPLGPEMRRHWIDCARQICGRMREVLGAVAEMGANGIGVDVIAVGIQIACIFDAALCKAVLPDRHARFETERESTLDELHGLFEGDVLCRRDQDMNVIGHEDECVELVASFGAVVFEQVEEKVRVRVGLKEAAAIRGHGGDEEGADFLRGEFHAGEVRGA